MEFFERDGISLNYPGNWQLESENSDEGWSVSLQSPGTAFLLVNFIEGIDDPDEIANAALDGLLTEYPKLDSEVAVENISGLPALGYNVNFIHLDLTITCWIRAVPAGGGALLIMAQCCDDELEESEAILRAIFLSIKIED